MHRLIGLFALFCSACGVAPQPESAKTVAAFEIPLSSDADRGALLGLMQRTALANGYHVDATGPEDLKRLSEVSTMTFHAAVWRGDDDEEVIASAMDSQDRLGRVWIAFAKGENPVRLQIFRERLMRVVHQRWPETRSLPIMPTGAIPLSTDMVRTSEGYRVKPESAAKYAAGPT